MPVVHIDFQPYGGKLKYGSELFNAILQKLSDLLRRKTFEDNEDNLEFERFDSDRPANEVASVFVEQFCKLTNDLEQHKYKLPVICLLDEIERIIPTEADSRKRVEEFNSFFGTLRALSQEKKSLSLLVADVHPDFNRFGTWTQQNVSTNPVHQFFKEENLCPFSEEETRSMLKQIGQLMGVKFEPQILTTIQELSGGHPFISRQITSLLYQKAPRQERDDFKLITKEAAEPYLRRTLKYSGILKDYFQQNIWADLNKRNSELEMNILRLLACNEKLAEISIESVLLDKLDEEFSQDNYESALLYLTDSGLLKHHQSEGEDEYSLQIQLMANWLQRTMTKEEINQWTIPSETLN